MVRQIALEFLHHERGSRLIPESEETTLAIAAILAESNRKTDWTIKHLAPISIPYWIVQVSERNSILLSAFGESSLSIKLSEDTSLGSIRRIISNEIRDFDDIPTAVEKALPLIHNVEPKSHQIPNLLDPSLFVDQGEHFVEVEPTAKLNILDMKIDSQTALNISQEFQSIIDGARTRLKNIEELQRLTKELLTDRLRALDNVIETEMARWDKRIQTNEESSELRLQVLGERESQSVYSLKEKRKQDERVLIANFARETAEMDAFFVRILEEIRAARQEIGSATTSVEEAVHRCNILIDYLKDTIPGYAEVVNQIKSSADSTLEKARAFDLQLNGDVEKESQATESQIKEVHQKLASLKAERNAQHSEYNALRQRVQGAIEKIDNQVNKRANVLRGELADIQSFILDNDSIRGLAPLTLAYVRTYVVRYNHGQPVVFTPGLIQENRITLPYTHQPLDRKFADFIKNSIQSHYNTSPSFSTAFDKTSLAGSVFQDRRISKAFSKGLDDLWSRKLLSEGLKEKLVRLFAKHFGKCPECGEEISANDMFCPKCGTELS